MFKFNFLGSFDAVLLFPTFFFCKLQLSIIEFQQRLAPRVFKYTSRMEIHFYVRKLTPRTLIVDLEPTVIDEIRTGVYKNLFNPNSLVSGKEDASNNFARGYYSIGGEAIGLVLDRVCKIWETCSKPAGFIVFRYFNQILIESKNFYKNSSR